MQDVTLWVFLPIFFTMLLVALLQDNLRLLFLEKRSSGPLPESRLRREHLLQRAAWLRTNGSLLPENSFRRHRAYMTNSENGRLSVMVKEAAGDSMLAKLTLSLVESWGRGAGGGMLAQYLLNFVPTLLLGLFVNHFFGGYVVGRLPFPLPVSFKSLLHGGIYLPQLDTCYLSSLSWYVLSLMGLRSVAALLVFDYAALRAAPVQQQQQGAMPSPMITSMLMGMPLPGVNMGSSEDQLAAAERTKLHVGGVHDVALLRDVEERLTKLL